MPDGATDLPAVPLPPRPAPYRPPPTARPARRRLDKGDKYMPLDPSFTIKEVKMHPTESEWMMASHLTDGTPPSQLGR